MYSLIIISVKHQTSSNEPLWSWDITFYSRCILVMQWHARRNDTPKGQLILSYTSVQVPYSSETYCSLEHKHIQNHCCHCYDCLPDHGIEDHVKAMMHSYTSIRVENISTIKIDNYVPIAGQWSQRPVCLIACLACPAAVYKCGDWWYFANLLLHFHCYVYTYVILLVALCGNDKPQTHTPDQHTHSTTNSRDTISCCGQTHRIIHQYHVNIGIVHIVMCIVLGW